MTPPMVAVAATAIIFVRLVLLKLVLQDLFTLLKNRCLNLSLSMTIGKTLIAKISGTVKQTLTS